MKYEQEFYFDLIENLSIGIYKIEIYPQKKVILANKRFFHIFDFTTKSSILEKNITSLSLEKRQENLLNKIIDPNNYFETESKILKSNQKFIWVQIIKKIIKKGNKTYIEGIIKDITEKKESQKNLKISQSRINSLAKVKDEFITLASHGLRTPLTAIRGYSSMLLESDSLHQEDKKQIQIIAHSAEKLSKMISRMIDLSQLETLHQTKTERVSLNNLVEKIKNNFLNLAKQKNVTMEKIVSNHSNIILKTEAEKLQKILEILLENAISFNSSSGKVKIKINQKSSFIKISIEDEGEGIAKKYHQTIFQKFSRSSDLLNTKNTSLSLALCKELVQYLGGKIWMENAPQKGSIFIFTLPI